ncbi:NAD-dependent epimerase/dehydratase family protein [Agrobacterium sp. Azo12]|uniref:NAD-dependent epimerase/dehydratase family protein n=1 Tax=Agrobacterium sp. Azo12 TaxID=3031129 RepID=UPI0023D84FCA|nr:NAD-dependent epimerase/dehydratase family protein [Agrobacterium sp. Azo12]MDO5896974.1 NAD-dependent epimerase/dehydratase family protein [Agrobacterium sp. Azo12]
MIGVTGASGYIGSAVVRTLSETGPVFAIGRAETCDVLPANAVWRSMSVNQPTPSLFEGCDSVIHLAGLAHAQGGVSGEKDFDAANRQLAVDCALAAYNSGVKRFVFVSTMAVHGNWSINPIRADSELRLDTPYARSKWAGEQALRELCFSLNMELCIVRPAMVYGYQSPGNFARLLKLVEFGMPLPFKSMTSKRSFTSVQNLSSFLIACTQAELPEISTFVFGDGSDWSTLELVTKIANFKNLRLRLFSIPSFVFSRASEFAGRKREYESLSKPMTIEWEHAWNECKWSPPYTPESCMTEAVMNR